MKNPSVDFLIQKLQNLRLKETDVLQQLEEAKIIETEQENSPNTRRTETEQENNRNDCGLEPGDRVKITNRVRHVKGKTVTIGYNYGSVNCVDRE